ncbi:ParB N-terminal domain-containing protein [Atlantibacter hermannii]|uniref:ParB N-terminal domain-containing protein n=1 Tax=Atlantibacter hermannii TaxID=565 RepID=UPI00289AFD04|nr:ParB N-terminal domain-containing protein [Atlantibacter hermannii]
MSDVEMIAVDDLELDDANPRLPNAVERTQQAMINYIASSTSLEDLMSAISQNGFFSGEPLIVIPGDNGKFKVIEGNRRLTAVKLILNPYLSDNPSARAINIHNENKSVFDALPVIIKQSRNDVLPYLGFRHITGIKQWEPLAKARYIEQIFDITNPSLSASERYHEVAKIIGSRRDHIKRNLDALAVYRRIEKDDFYGIDELNEQSIKFSILSTALADERIGAFVGVDIKKDGETIPTDPIINPRYLNDIAIKELTEWLYLRDKEGNTKVGESRNLRQLAAIVNNSKALQQFREGASLVVAYQLTSDISEDFLEILYQIETLMIEAAGMVANVDYNSSAYEVAKRINKNIKMIGKELAEKEKGDDDF